MKISLAICAQAKMLNSVVAVAQDILVVFLVIV